MSRNYRREILVLALAGAIIMVTGTSLAKPELVQVKGEDLPYLTPYPGSVRVEFEQKDFDSMKFATSYVEGGDKQEKDVEGKSYRIHYTLLGNKGKLELLRNYENALKAKGWEIIRAKNNDDMLFEGCITAHKTGSPEIWARISSEDPNNDEDSTFVNYYFEVVEVKAMDQVVELKDASALKKELDASGRVAVYGINFDTGKATITADSEKVLKEIGKLLTDNPSLKLSIEGHTDNVGDAKANQKLSEDRAAAVKDYLVKNHKIAANRLSTKGFGSTKPVADNGTADGKAKNRRVELVKQ